MVEVMTYDKIQILLWQLKIHLNRIVKIDFIGLDGLNNAGSIIISNTL
jgi:hypothetical protein